MSAHRVLIGIATAFLAGQALAQTPPSQAAPFQAETPRSMPPELAAAIGAWGVCRGRVVAERMSGTDSADAIAAEAMKRCEPDQAKSRTVAVKAFGRAGSVLIDQTALSARGQVVELVTEKRSGAPIDDPNVIWGDCLGRQARQGAAGRAGVDAIVQQAYAACRDQEQKTRVALEAQVGHDQATTLMGQLRTLFRDQAPKLIAQIRKGP